MVYSPSVIYEIIHLTPSFTIALLKLTHNKLKFFVYKCVINFIYTNFLQAFYRQGLLPLLAKYLISIMNRTLYFSKYQSTISNHIFNSLTKNLTLPCFKTNKLTNFALISLQKLHRSKFFTFTSLLISGGIYTTLHKSTHPKVNCQTLEILQPKREKNSFVYICGKLIVNLLFLRTIYSLFAMFTNPTMAAYAFIELLTFWGAFLVDGALDSWYDNSQETNNQND